MLTHFNRTSVGFARRRASRRADVNIQARVRAIFALSPFRNVVTSEPDAPVPSTVRSAILSDSTKTLTPKTCYAKLKIELLLVNNSHQSYFRLP